MNINMKFDDTEIKNIVGYKISVGFQPRAGFQGAFYIYVEQRLESRNNKLAEVTLGNTETTPRGTLSFSSNDITYSFDNIDMKAIKTIITHRERSRIIEFRYDDQVSDSKDNLKPNITLTNNINDDLNGALKSMKISFDGGEEELLAFNSFQQPDVAPIFQFSHRRNNQNSWLSKIVEANKKRIEEDGKFEPFEIAFQPQQLVVNDTDVIGILIDESYGTMLDHPLASINEISMKNIGEMASLARLELNEYKPASLVKMYNSKEFKRGSISSMAVETATVLFKTGSYSDFKIV